LWHGGQVADPLTYSSDIKRGPRHPVLAFIVKTGGHGSWSPFLFAERPLISDPVLSPGDRRAC
jgi:hypothetical protein